LRQADPPSREYYQLCIGSVNWKKDGEGATKDCIVIIIILIIIIIEITKLNFSMVGNDELGRMRKEAVIVVSIIILLFP
jgi:hypothetical protein